MALVLVLCVMALAGILSYALLSTASIQAAASNNGVAAAIAEAQAQAGVKLAMYYLINPQYAPSLAVSNGVSYWPGSNNTAVTFASPSAQMPGNVTIAVTPPALQATNIYTVVAAGSSAGSGIGGGAITRTVTAQVELTYQVEQAVASNQSSTVLNSGVTVSGSPIAVRAAGSLFINTGASVTGDAAVTSESGSGAFSGTVISPPSGYPAPTSTTLNHYATYLYQGGMYPAQALTTGTLTSSNLPTYNPTTNPLNVFYYNGNITVTSTINFTGTLIALNGNFIVQSSGSTITAMATMPALVVDKSLEVKSSHQSMTVNGVVYAGAGLASAGGPNTGSILTINGGLMVNSGSITPPTGTTLVINYALGNASAPALSSVPNAVQLISWSQ
jgi:hypothetical protein